MLLVMLGAPLLAAVTLRLLGGYRALAVGFRGDRPRLRGRRHRRLAADLALPARPQSGARGPLLRDRQRARGPARGPGRRRHRRGAEWIRAPRLAARGGGRLPHRVVCSLPSSSPPGASAPTSAPRSSSPWARRSRASALAGAAAAFGPVRGRAAARRPRPACPGRPRLRRRRPPHPLGPRRRWARRPRRCRPAPAPALRQQLRPADRLRLPAADRCPGRDRDRSPRPAGGVARRSRWRCAPG